MNGPAQLRAIVSLTMGGLVRLNNIRVVKGKTGLFVAMPSQKGFNNEPEAMREPHFKMVTKEDQKELNDYVLKNYRAVPGIPQE